MASGYGMNGGPGRCFAHWQEVLTCYVSNNDESDPNARGKCVPALDDYYECLHHKKEEARGLAIQKAYRKADAARTDRSMDLTAAQIRKLGVLEGTLEEKHLKPNRFLPHLTRN